MLTFGWASAENVINVSAPQTGSANAIVADAIEQLKAKGGGTLRMAFGQYLFDRDEAAVKLYHISNTTSAEENPDPVKHIAILLKDARDITIDGGGSTFMLDGEMTAFVVDSCRNITLKNFAIDQINPTAPEMTLAADMGNTLVYRVHPASRYEIRDNGRQLYWVGKGWEFTGGIAQTYYPEHDTTSRTWSPMENITSVKELEPGLLAITYTSHPQQKIGWTYQMRDSFRDEVCGFIGNSSNTTLSDIDIYYAGNFGIVGQCSRDITYRRVNFEPEAGSGRTNTGFADFCQFSGCAGLIKVENCRFVGAHDDPINVHGTHLKVVSVDSPRTARVRYMHGQSFGFQSFFRGDEVEFVNRSTLLAEGQAKVKSAHMVNDYEIELTFDRDIPSSIAGSDNYAIENVSLTPEVEIRGCYFARVPTRGILVTTRRKVVIEDNTFFRMSMSAILLSDDARGWYESGPCRDVTIRRNRFIECGEPVINIWPEISEFAGPVHKNVTITDNLFRLRDGQAVRANAIDGLHISGNIFTGNYNPDNIISVENGSNLNINN